MADLSVRLADLDAAPERDLVVSLVDDYSRDEMGAGAPLGAEQRARLGTALRDHGTTRVLLAFEGDDAVGVAVCFLAFSTFAAAQIWNVHDLSVRSTHRGRGIGTALLAAAERHARSLGCCRLTLEVQRDNTRAQAVYQAFGFEGMGGDYWFLSKALEG